MSAVSQLFMFHTGRARVRRSALEAEAPREICWLPVLCFLAVHPRGPVLIDSGLGTRFLGRTARGWGRLASMAVRLTFVAGMDCRSRIAECGIDPNDVADGLLTHLHFDHAGAVADLPRTRFRVSRRELDLRRTHHGLGALRRGYELGDFEAQPNLEPFDWEASDALEPFDAAFDLFGDGAVRAIPTPGHSPGHASVLLRITGGREVLLAGDAAFTQAQITGSRELGLLPRRVANDLQGARDSLHRLRALARRREGLTVLTSHDPDQGDDVALGPTQLLE